MFSRIATVGIISAGMTLNLNRRSANCSASVNYPFDPKVI
jgi:hypothetical protein